MKFRFGLLPRPANLSGRVGGILTPLSEGFHYLHLIDETYLNVITIGKSGGRSRSFPLRTEKTPSNSDPKEIYCSDFRRKGLKSQQNSYWSVKKSPGSWKTKGDRSQGWTPSSPLPHFKAIPGNYFRCGYYSSLGKEIALATKEESVFFHELAHCAHEKVKGSLKAGQDPLQEIVAELSAQALCSIVGKKTG